MLQSVVTRRADKTGYRSPELRANAETGDLQYNWFFTTFYKLSMFVSLFFRQILDASRYSNVD